jgi:hypothetical protein
MDNGDYDPSLDRAGYRNGFHVATVYVRTGRWLERVPPEYRAELKIIREKYLRARKFEPKSMGSTVSMLRDYWSSIFTDPDAWECWCLEITSIRQKSRAQKYRYWRALVAGHR